MLGFGPQEKCASLNFLGKAKQRPVVGHYGRHVEDDQGFVEIKR